MTSQHIQHAIIEAIRRQAPPDQNLADVLAPVLNLNKNAVYKRISGITPLTLEDLTLLCQHFQLPFHQIFYPGAPGFVAEYSGFAAPTSVLEYLALLDRDLAALRQDPACEIWHVTIGMPDFYFFYFEELTQFQVFTWERLVWGNPGWKQVKFSLDLSEKENYLTLTKRLANHFAQLPVTEIWNEYVLDNFFQQLLYVTGSRLFSKKEDIRRLLACSEEMIAHLQTMAVLGRRFLPGASTSENAGPWRLYFNEMMKNNIFFLVKTSSEEVVYTVFDNPNFIKTSDPAIVNHTRSVFDSLVSRSVRVDSSGERFQDVFFEKLKARQQYFLEKILKML